MNAGEAEWEHYLSELRQHIESDFCALALYDASSRQIRWIAASGNINEKFRYMVNRPGQGISGEVIRIGRTVQRTCTSDEQRRSVDSIMLAERLVVAAATPVRTEDNETMGILLMGRRIGAIYTTPELAILEKAATYFSRKPETA